MQPQNVAPNVSEAACDFAFTSEQFCEYSRICDFMSKWKKWLAQIVLTVYVVLMIILSYSALRFPVDAVLLLPSILGIPALVICIGLATQSPPLWFWRRKRRGIMKMYAKRLGMRYPELVDQCSFWFEDGWLTMITEEVNVKAPLRDVRWVRRSGDLVVIGCLDDSYSMDTDYLIGEKGYKAIPGIAFLASKLEDADANDLIAMLEPYIRQNRREYFTKLRFWRLEDDE